MKTKEKLLEAIQNLTDFDTIEDYIDYLLQLEQGNLESGMTATSEDYQCFRRILTTIIK